MWRNWGKYFLLKQIASEKADCFFKEGTEFLEMAFPYSPLCFVKQFNLNFNWTTAMFDIFSDVLQCSTRYKNIFDKFPSIYFNFNFH